MSQSRNKVQDARKLLETLSLRAQAELKVLLAKGQASSSAQLAAVGAELEKLGKKLQELAAKAKANGKAAEGARNSTQPGAPTVQ